jgi:hypothetical protein
VAGCRYVSHLHAASVNWSVCVAVMLTRTTKHIALATLLVPNIRSAADCTPSKPWCHKSPHNPTTLLTLTLLSRYW